MVGRAVLIECLEHENIESVLAVNRNPLDIKHPKLIEILHNDFSNLESIKVDLAGYDACFYCMGVSALGMKEKDYHRITYAMTEAFAVTLYSLNPGMVFNYVSGAGTDSACVRPSFEPGACNSSCHWRCIWRA